MNYTWRKFSHQINHFKYRVGQKRHKFLKFAVETDTLPLFGRAASKENSLFLPYLVSYILHCLNFPPLFTNLPV